MRASTEGSCYEIAGKFFIAAKRSGQFPKDLTLVHGFLRFESGKEINHAWVESASKNCVFDMTQPEGSQLIDFQFYYNRVIKIQAHYQKLAIVQYLRKVTGTWGPFRWKEEMERLLASLDQ